MINDKDADNYLFGNDGGKVPTQVRLAPEDSKGRGNVLSMPDHPTRRLVHIGVEELGVAVARADHPVVRDGQTLLFVDPVPKTVRACDNVYRRRGSVSPFSPRTSRFLVILQSLHMLSRDVDAARKGGG